MRIGSTLQQEGLRQGHSSSPHLFNLVADVFTKMMSKAAAQGHISGLLPEVVPGGTLQYADDTLLLLENNLTKARNFTWLLTCFEQVSGMRINYDKCDTVTLEHLQHSSILQ